MSTVTKIGEMKREDDLSKEMYNVLVAIGESAAIDILSEQIGYLVAVRGPFQFVILADGKTARIFNYPPAVAAIIDDLGVLGLDDLTVDASAFTGTSPLKFTVRISSSAASPDEFKISLEGAAEGAATPITAGVAQAVSAGVTITFAAGDGHTLNSTYTITVFPTTGTSFLAELLGYGG